MAQLMIIGAGGVGSWLLPKLAKLGGTLVVADGDKLEPKNMDRQLFDEEHIGMNKAIALAMKYRLDDAAIDEYFHSGASFVRDIGAADILFCCADNHACRREVLAVCDEKDCRAVIAANEYTDAEAYWYERDMKDTPNDPRLFYPNMLTDHSGDPLGPPGCQGQAQEENRQLVLANDMASALAGSLYWFHTQERPGRDVADKPHFPVHYKFGLYGPRLIKWGDRR